MPNDSHRPDVAVFIDFENVYVSVRDKLDANPNFESIMERCEDLGRVVIARAYADWYRYPRVTSALYANGIEPMYVPTYYYDRDMGRTGRPIKNSVDMNLCVDAMKTLYTNPNIEKFVLATGDRDFIPLVNTIRQQGKEVIVIGIGGAASAHLAQSADEFIFYETLVGKSVGGRTVDDVPRAKMPEKGRDQEYTEEAPAPRRERDRDRDRDREPQRPEVAATNGAATPAPAEPTPPEPFTAEPAQPDVYDTLVRAINLARERGYVCSFGSLKLLMKELMGGDFKESRYKDGQGRPFAKFKDFVMEAERRGKVQVFTNGTVNEVFLPGEDPYKLSQFAAELKVDPDASPITLTETPADTRAESRLASPAGRRRRRRRSGRQPGQPVNGTVFEENIEDLEAEELDELEGDEQETPDQEAVPEFRLVLPNLMDDAEAAEIFEELLDQIEAEDNDTTTLSQADPDTILEPDTSDVVESVAGQAGDGVDMAAETASGARPFGDADWQFLSDVLTEYARPASFAQIHDVLRGARNRMSVPRTNEELRTLVKQAINTGRLSRQGKGNRVSYRLAEPQAEQAETPEQTDAPDQMALIEQAQAQDDQIEQTEGAQPEQGGDRVATLAVELAEATGSSVLDGLGDAAELASDPEQARREVAEIQQAATGIALEPASDVSGVAAFAPAEEAAGEQAPAEEAPAPRRRRRRAAAQDEQQTQPAEAAPAAEAPAEAAPKRRRRKAAPAEEQAAASTETPAGEAEAPKRTRRRRKSADEGQE